MWIIRTRFTPWLLLSLLLFAAAAALYLSTLPPDLIFDGGVSVDSAELQRVAYRLGIAHSTGYPIWTALAHGMAVIGAALGGSPYAWVSALSALMGAGVLVLFFTLARTVGHPLTALGAAAALAVTGSVWHASTIAEVQTLHGVIVAGLLSAAVAHVRRPERFAPVLLMAGLAGVGLAHHRTVVLAFPAAALSLLLAGQWRRWSPRQIALLGIAGVLPLASYALLYWRATDPHVVFSTRPTWYPSPLTSASITDLIRGTFQDGQSLNNNFDLSLGTAGARFASVLARLAADFRAFGVLAGAAGLVILVIRQRRVGLVVAVYTAVHWVFLMGWKIDDPKSPIYHYPLLIGLALGLVALFSWGTALEAPPETRRGRWTAARAIVLSAPVVLLAVDLYTANRPLRDLHDDTRTAQYQAELAQLPPEAVLFTRQWQPEVFITLEYLDERGVRSPIPAGTDLWWVPLDQMNNPALDVYIGLSMRSTYGLYSGATWFQEEHGIAFSGTGTTYFLQAHRADDPRLAQEADRATVVQAAITPEITLHSYTVQQTAQGFGVTLYWRALADSPPEYAVYTHLRTYSQRCDIATVTALLAQDDSAAPVDGAMPTRIWRAGQTVRDTYWIPWEGTLPDNAALVFGMTRGGERVGEFCVP